VGVALDNRNVPSKQYPVYVYGTNLITNNGNHGLVISSYGQVTLSNLSAIDNGFNSLDAFGDGANIQNDGGTYPKSVVIKGANVFNSSDNTGLVVTSDGAISVSNITARGNGTVGANLDNDNSLTAQTNVSIAGYGLFEFNGLCCGDQMGLKINSHGAVTLYNILARDNYGTGVSIYTIGLTTVHAVTLNGTNTFTNNGDSGSESGLMVNADGTIKVSNLTAMNNNYDGVYLNNYDNWFTNPYRITATPLVPFASFGSVFVNGFGYISDNSHVGLAVYTHGSVTLNRITESGSLVGIGIEADGNVTLVCSSVSGNSLGGVSIDTPGVITLKGLIFYGFSPGGNELFSSYSSLVRTTCP
jgi:hypothetical protein